MVKITKEYLINKFFPVNYWRKPMSPMDARLLSLFTNSDLFNNLNLTTELVEKFVFKYEYKRHEDSEKTKIIESIQGRRSGERLKDQYYSGYMKLISDYSKYDVSIQNVGRFPILLVSNKQVALISGNLSLQRMIEFICHQNIYKFGIIHDFFTDNKIPSDEHYMINWLNLDQDAISALSAELELIRNEFLSEAVEAKKRHKKF